VPGIPPSAEAGACAESDLGGKRRDGKVESAFLRNTSVFAYLHESYGMLREIVFDTETTGLDPNNGDRLIELGCVEIVNRIPTGREFHRYINPERDISAEAVAVHGLTVEFLKDKPRFRDVADEFLGFIGDAPLVAHNAAFDLSFLNAELERVPRPPLSAARIVDTLALSRRRHPAGPHNLDALCKRYGIDLSQRTKHSALLDSMLLASVYVELLGERQATLGLNGQGGAELAAYAKRGQARQRPAPLPSRLSAEAEQAHRTFVKTLGTDALWLRYSDP
jgi:DNA polymerase-3 subunit epsilon